MNKDLENMIKENVKEYQEVLISWRIEECNEYDILKYSENPYVEEVIGDTYYICLLCEEKFWTYEDVMNHIIEEHFKLENNDRGDDYEGNVSLLR